MGKYFGNSGQAIPLFLVMFAVIGLIFFLFFSNTFSFKDKIFKDTFIKQYSNAFESENNENLKEANTKRYNLFENQINPLSQFKKINFTCVNSSFNEVLELECENAELESIYRFSSNSAFILTGFINPKHSNSSDFFDISLGIFEDDGQYKKAILRFGVESLGDIYLKTYHEGKVSKSTIQKYNKEKLPFKIVFTKLEDHSFIYIYINGSKDPVSKQEVEVSAKLGVLIQCRSLFQSCIFGDLAASGEKVE